MKYTKILPLSLLATANICPITAAQDTAPIPAIDAAAVAKTQRANHFSALQLLPDSADAWAAINICNIADTISKATDNRTTVAVPFQAIDSVAIGISDTTPQAIENVGKMAAIFLKSRMIPALEPWEHAAAPHAGKVIRQYMTDYEAKAKRAERLDVWKLAAATELPAFTAAVTFKPGIKTLIAPALENYRNQIADELRSELPATVENYTANGWQGIKISKLAVNNISWLTSDIISAMAAKEYYIVYRFNGDTLLLRTTGNESELAAPYNRLINSDKATLLDQMQPQSAALGCLYISPHIVNALKGVHGEALQAPIRVLKDILAQAGTAYPQSKPATDKALLGIDTICAEFAKLLPQHKHPLTIALWQDGDMHLQCETDACGYSFTTAQLNTAAPSNAIIHAYGSTLVQQNPTNWAQILNASVDIAGGIATTMPAYEAAVIRTAANYLQQIPAMAGICFSPVLRMYQAIGNGWTFSMDAEGTHHTPIWYDGKEQATYPQAFPRFTASFLLTDRAAFEQGLNQTKDAVIALSGINHTKDGRDIAKLLDFTAETRDNTTVYTATHAKLQQETGQPFAYSISDSRVCLTTDATCITPMQTTNTSAVCGISIQVKLRPIVEAFRKNLYGEIEHFSHLRTAKRNEWTEFCQQAIINARIRVQKAEKLIYYLDNIKADITTENGKLRTRIDVSTPCLK